MAASQGFFSRFPPILFVVGLVALVAVIAMLTLNGGTLSIGGGKNVAGSATEARSARLPGEYVTCIFNGSTTLTSCNSSHGGCSGVGSCTAVVSGKMKTKLTWSSQCNGNPTTTIDGRDETILFQCPNAPVQVREIVTCYFNGSTSNQVCVGVGPNIAVNCSGISSCRVGVYGVQGSKFTWSSSCKGTSLTTMDGRSENVYFACPQQCQDECPKIGAASCTNETQVMICGNNDDDACTEWVLGDICSYGTACLGGACVDDQCWDSDGNDPFTLGWVNWTTGGESYVLMDTCGYGGSNTLYEYTCDGNRMRSDSIPCSLGCTQGVCITNQTGNGTG